MNKFILIAVTCWTLFISAMAGAELYETESYVGGNVVGLKFSDEGFEDDLSLHSANARFGAQFGDYAALEWRLGTGLESDGLNVGGEQLDVNLDIFYGAYLLGGFPVSERIQPYALIGYTQAEFERSALGATGEIEESDISFGAGINIELVEDFAINAEYIRYIKEDGIELSGPSVGLVYSF